jgi:hypothetical protein
MLHARDELKVNVVDGLAIFIAVNQVQRSATNALDSRQVQFHGAGAQLYGLGAQLESALVGEV